MSVLGLDVGTSTCKGIVLSASGEILAQAQLSYAEAVEVSGLTAQIDPKVFCDHTAQVIRILAEKTANDPIEAISVSSHGETLIPIDAHGEALCGAMLSMDRRCTPCSDELIARMGQEKIYSITGSMMHPQFPVPKVMWLKREHPEIAGKAVHYDTASDHIYRMLGHANAVDCSMASRFGGFDIAKRAWSEEILGEAGISPAEFSKPVCGGTPLGYIPASIARQLGLSDKVMLVAGGHDQPCAAIGMGNVDADTITVSAGSYECAIRTSGKPLNDANGMRYGLNSYCHVLPDQYVTLAFFVSGMMVKWYLDTFCKEEKRLAKEQGSSVYALMEAGCQARPTGICVTPHIYGAMNPEWSEKATAKVAGLTASATKADFYKAVMEGTSCELDLNIQVLEKLTHPATRLLMTGGGTQSAMWSQIRADVTGKRIDVVDSQAEASCVGAAILAGIGAKVFADPADANSKIRRNVRNYIPGQPGAYDSQKALYLSLHCPGLMD